MIELGGGSLVLRAPFENEISESYAADLITSSSRNLYDEDFKRILDQCMKHGLVSKGCNTATINLKKAAILETSRYKQASLISIFFGTLLSEEEKLVMDRDVAWDNSTEVSIAIQFPGKYQYTYIHLRSKEPDSDFDDHAWNKFMKETFGVSDALTEVFETWRSAASSNVMFSSSIKVVDFSRFCFDDDGTLIEIGFQKRSVESEEFKSTVICIFKRENGVYFFYNRGIFKPVHDVNALLSMLLIYLDTA
jgi:hypothetical protein